jgi:hypothetical protein
VPAAVREQCSQAAATAAAAAAHGDTSSTSSPGAPAAAAAAAAHPQLAQQLEAEQQQQRVSPCQNCGIGWGLLLLLSLLMPQQVMTCGLPGLSGECLLPAARAVCGFVVTLCICQGGMPMATRRLLSVCAVVCDGFAQQSADTLGLVGMWHWYLPFCCCPFAAFRAFLLLYLAPEQVCLLKNYNLAVVLASLLPSCSKACRFQACAVSA